MKNSEYFDNTTVEGIVVSLKEHKSNLGQDYNWRKPDYLALTEIIGYNNNDLKELENLSLFEQGLRLKEILPVHLNKGGRLNEKLACWIIKDWGGIRGTKKENEVEDFYHVQECLNGRGKPKFERISSVSKVLSFSKPNEYVIFDSRVAFSLNWIISSLDGRCPFHPLPSRNKKIIAGMKELTHKGGSETSCIPKDITYTEANNLIREVNKRLWKEDENKQNKPYYTEMLLFAIAPTLADK